MTERGLPIVNGAPACPFVAFDDDREERASEPDPRHRCYAEIRPAPRAQAHQDAYCLSSAFAVCPTFQDWAKREGARVHEEGQPATPRSDEPARRNPQRDWSAPPPWLGPPELDPARGGRDLNSPAAQEFPAGRRRPESGLAGSLAHQIALDGAPLPEVHLPAGHGDESTGRPPGRGSDPARGTDPADRYARPIGAALGSGAVFGAGTSGAAFAPGEAFDAGDDGDDEDDDESVGRDRAGRAASPGGRAEGRSRIGGILPGDRRPRVGDTRPRRRSNEPSAPPWERPHRYEAYPTLRTRIGLPAVSRVALLAGVLGLAALALFFLPALLGFGSPKGTPAPSATPARTGLPSASPDASVPAGPTPQVYIIQPNDTMSKIAARFGIPLVDLVAANKEKYPNPDKIIVGDTLIIPAPVPTGFSDAGTPVPGASRTPGPTPTPVKTTTPTKTPAR